MKNADLHWSSVEELFRGIMNSNVSNGVREMRKLWDNNKSWMFPYFDDDGRRTLILDPTKDDTCYEDVHYFDVVNGFKPTAQKMAVKYPFLVPDDAEKAISILHSLAFFLTEDELFKNSMNRRYSFVDLIPGTKSSKFLKKLVEYAAIGEKPSEFNSYLTNEIANISKVVDFYGRDNVANLVDFLQSIFSQMISGIKVAETKVVLSVNPMDILLSSANTTGWRSCHNIYSGEYRTGPVSYLCDKVTAVCYAATKESSPEFVSLNYPMKKWRQMVYFDKRHHSAILSREYPTASDLFLEYARKLAGTFLEELVGEECGWNYLKDPELESDYYVAEDSFAYRDDASCRVVLKEIGENPDVEMGHAIPCLLCGELRDEGDVGQFDAGCCQEERHTCPSCGETHIESNMETGPDGRWYCSDCWSDKYATCYRCGDVDLKDNLTWLGDDPYCEYCTKLVAVQCNDCSEFVHKDDASTDINKEIFYCEDCIDNHSICEECETFCDDLTLTIHGDECCPDCLEVCPGCEAILTIGKQCTECEAHKFEECTV